MGLFSKKDENKEIQSFIFYTKSGSVYLAYKEHQFYYLHKVGSHEKSVLIGFLPEQFRNPKTRQASDTVVLPQGILTGTDILDQGNSSIKHLKNNYVLAMMDEREYNRLLEAHHKHQTLVIQSLIAQCGATSEITHIFRQIA